MTTCKNCVIVGTHRRRINLSLAVLRLIIHQESFLPCLRRFHCLLFQPFHPLMTFRRRQLLTISTISQCLKVTTQNILMTCLQRSWITLEPQRQDLSMKTRQLMTWCRLCPVQDLLWPVLITTFCLLVTLSCQGSASVTCLGYPLWACQVVTRWWRQCTGSQHSCCHHQEEFPIPHSDQTIKMFGMVWHHWCSLLDNMFPAPPSDPSTIKHG